jgi:hypothetical protein
MRRFGQVLAFLGLLIGGATAIALTLPIHLVGIAWLIAVGMVKLTFVASFGLIAGGAVLQRTALRREERARLSAPREP